MSNKLNLYILVVFYYIKKIKSFALQYANKIISHWLLSLELIFKFKYNFTHFLFQSYQLQSVWNFHCLPSFPFFISLTPFYPFVLSRSFNIVSAGFIAIFFIIVLLMFQKLSLSVMSYDEALLYCSIIYEC